MSSQEVTSAAADSPEREDPGNASFAAPTIPKVVVGLDPRSLELAAAPHSTYDGAYVLGHAPLVVDTRNATRDVAAMFPGRIVRA